MPQDKYKAVREAVIKSIHKCPCLDEHKECPTAPRELRLADALDAMPVGYFIDSTFEFWKMKGKTFDDGIEPCGEAWDQFNTLEAQSAETIDFLFKILCK